MNLHPDLEALAARYRDLHAAASAGHITPDDALATLNGLSVTDGTGAVWKINHNGEFTRAQFAGAPTAVSDPGAYVGPETVTSNPETGAFNVGPQQAPTSPTWDENAPVGGFGTPAGGFGDPFPTTTAHHTPTGGFGTPPQAPDGGSPFDPAPTPAAGTPATDPTLHSPFAPGAVHSGATAPAGRSLFDESATHRPTVISRVLETLKRNKFLVIIAAVALIFVANKVLAGSETGTKIPHSTPTAASTPDDGSTPAALPTDPAEEPTAGTTPQAPAAALPSGDDVAKVVTALTSGDRTLIAKQIVGAPDAALVAHAAALYAGLKKAGLTLDTGATAPGTEANTALQNWTITSGSTTLLSTPVTWVKQGTGWVLSDVPLPR